MKENSAFKVFIIIGEFGSTVINYPNCVFGTNVNKTLDAC